MKPLHGTGFIQTTMSRIKEINDRLDFLKKEIKEYYNKYNLMEDGTIANPHIPINKENHKEWTLQEATKIHSRYEPELAKLFNELDEIGTNTQWDQKLTNPNTTWDKPNEDNPYPRTGGIAT